MNGVAGLYKNEMLKTIRQTGMKVILIIFAVLMAAIPTVLIGASKIFNNFFQNDYGYYEERLEDDKLSKIERAYYQAYKDRDDFFDSVSSNRDDWRILVYENDYYQTISDIAALSLLIDGEDPEKIGDYFYYVSVDDPDYVDHPVNDSPNTYAEESSYVEISDITVDEAIQLLEKEKLKKQSIEENVRKNDFQEFLNTTLSDYENDKVVLEGQISDIDVSLENNPSNITASASKKSLVQQLKCMDLIIDSYKILIERRVSSDSWEYKTVSQMLSNAAYDYTVYPPYTEDEYRVADVSQNYYNFENYNEYKAASEKSIAKADNSVARIKYSLENEIPLPEATEYSSKSMWQACISSICGLITVFMIICAGISVSSEYSSGSVRLLLIRPRKRWKVLLSKLFSIITYSAILMILTYIVVFVITLILNGASDIFQPDIFASNGSAYEINSFLSTLIVLSKCVVSGVMYMSFAFMLSACVGKSALAIALPFIVQVFSSTLYLISLYISSYWSAIKYLPLAYLDLSVFNQSASLSILGMASLDTPFSFGIGLAYNAVITVFLIFIAFAVFNKKQIKS